MGQPEYTMSIHQTALLFQNVEYYVNAEHVGQVNKAVFNPQGSKVLTAGVDKTARLWNVETGELLQTL